MGQLFELIADSALEKLDDDYDECHVCGRTDVDLYDYQGKLDFENGEIDDIYAVCAECIKTKKIKHLCDFEYIKTIEVYISTLELSAEEQEHIKKELIEKYQKTPSIPVFMQYEDRPLCCGDITEFVGHPANDKELVELTENVIYWEKRINKSDKPYDFRNVIPESLTEVAAFKCKHCDKAYYTFQFT